MENLASKDLAIYDKSLKSNYLNVAAGGLLMSGSASTSSGF